MATQTQVWTVLPNGRSVNGRLRVSIVVSPRLTPQAASEQVLAAYPEWLDWPRTLAGAAFRLRVSNQPVDLKVIGMADSDIWRRLLRDDTPVAGFEFRDMSRVNLRSYAVRNVMKILRTHYGRLAVQAAGTHPTLLPWKDAHPVLRGMLTDLGTRTRTINFGDRSIELPEPGFDRYYDDRNRENLEGRLNKLVFGPAGRYTTPAVGIGVDSAGNPQQGPAFTIRVLPPDWQDPDGGGLDPDQAQLMKQWNGPSEYALYQADRFYRRRVPTDAQRAMRRPTMQGVPPPPKAPDFDFHRILASYGDHPELMRRLGLVIDAVLPRDNPIEAALAGGAPAQGRMRLELSWSNGHDPAGDSCPQAAWFADGERFTMRPRTPDHRRGMLDLRGADDRPDDDKRTRFDVYQVDPDGAALKTVDFVLSAQRLLARSLGVNGNLVNPTGDGAVTYTTGDRQPVAALRSGGLGISRHGRAAAVAQGAASAALKDQAVRSGSPGQIVMFAEDVLRGYRVDVQPIVDGQPQRWRSLCQRVGDYRLTGTQATLDIEPDEGYVKGASTTSDADSPDDHYLHESMFRWTGWSLAAPRPGRTLRSRDDAGSGVQSETPEDVQDEHAAGNGLSVRFTAARGSLPRLRFGVAYRVRARLVDVAGNSLELDDPSLEKDTAVSEAVTYRRFEPLDPPALVQRARGSEGESLERLVIRSNFDADAAAYLGTSAFAAAIALPASQDFEYADRSERHAVPPKASQQMCETHAMFDALGGSPAEIRKAYAIAAREAGTLYDGGELVTPAALANVATTAEVPPRLPSPDNPVGDRLAPGQFVIHREAALATPYLPDPAAGGIAIRAEPGHALPGVTGPMALGPGAAVVFAPNQELVLLVEHAQDWPDTRGLRIVLRERAADTPEPACSEVFADTGEPKWDADARELTFFVAKGRIVRLRYASFVRADFIRTFGLPDWVDTEGERTFVQGMAGVGCGWMVTPYRPLVLVHATQAPVCLPRLLVLSIVSRGAGDVHATLAARIRLHGPSTGSFEVEADWSEWVDDIDKPGPERIDSHGALGAVQLAENHDDLFSLGPAVDAQAVDPNRPRARGDRHEFGDTKFRLVRYALRATTRFREYLPPSLGDQRDAVTRVGPPADGPRVQTGADDDAGAPVLDMPGTGGATIVPASAPPDDPRPMYVVPTFRWTQTAGNATLDITRLGNGLRVWLERPWFSSGDGELLGVVILGENRPFTDIGDAMVPLVTQWGLDPLWDTALPKHRSSTGDFTARVAAEDVELQERPGTMVRVVGHRVRWSTERGRWYCDIELDPGRSYMPFVRLALVRYQPHAIAKAKVSKVVLTEFAQVLPRRRGTFTRTGAQVRFNLRGTVPAGGPMKFPLDSEYQDISFIPGPGQVVENGRNRIELVLQTPDDGIGSDLAWKDSAVLASSLLGAAPAPTPLQPMPPAGPIVSQPPGSLPLPTPLPIQPVRPRGGTVLSANVHLGAAGALGPVLDIGTIGPIADLLDPSIWDATVTLPAGTAKPARVAVREFERYYTDRTVNEVRAGATRRRRVVEERLVYAAFFDI